MYTYVHVTERGQYSCLICTCTCTCTYHAYVKANRQTCREEQSIHTVLCVLLSAVYEYRNTYMYMFIRTYICMYMPYSKVGRISMAGSNKRMVTNLQGDSEGEGGAILSLH